MFQDSRQPVLRWLIVANLVFFVLSMLGPVRGPLFQWGALIPAATWGGGQIWRLVSYMFLHDGLLHIFFNMYMLWVFGTQLVDDMGEWRFLSFYAFCGIFAGVFSVIFYPLQGSAFTPVVGASGAILGVMWAYARHHPDATIAFFGILPMNARTAVWLMGGLSLLFAVFGGHAGGGIAHATHLFGILGAIVFFAVEPRLSELFAGWAKRREEKRVTAMADELLSRQEFYDTRVDPILKKISKHGVEALTREEKKILERAREMGRLDRNNAVDLDEWRKRNR